MSAPPPLAADLLGPPRSSEELFLPHGEPGSALRLTRVLARVTSWSGDCLLIEFCTPPTTSTSIQTTLFKAGHLSLVRGRERAVESIRCGLHYFAHRCCTDWEMEVGSTLLMFQLAW